MIRFTGTDAEKFLQGYLTVDTTALTDRWQLTALCNIKGRVVASGWVQRTEAGVDWVLHASLTERVMEFLAPYLRFAKTSASVAQEPIGYRLTPELVFAGVSGGESDATEALMAHLYAERIVLVDSTSSERHLPQMLGLTDIGAVSFSKGCYLGQEVVARAQHRGEVKRRLRAEEGTPQSGDEDVVLVSSAGCLAVRKAGS
jgi:folate-binding protein YgfZ